MLLSAWILTGVALFLVGLGVLEFGLHQRRLQQIPIRIHVNGTRGKSSVTRLIAAGLRAGGIRTVAKTTGTLPRVIDPSGKETPIPRSGRPNVIEQIYVVKGAIEHQPQAIVVECMALQPQLQWLCETKLVRSTHGVMTNARADHLDVMGPTEEDVARALAGTTPYGGVFFTAEQRHLGIFEKSSADRGSQLVIVGEKQIEAVSSAEMKKFSYIEHSENVALALQVCTALGVSRERALTGMQQATADPGAMTEVRVDYFGRKIYFVNGFAANDPESTKKIWDMSLERHRSIESRIAVFNCRADRPDRSRQLGEAFAQWTPADKVALMGSGTYIFAKAAQKKGVPADRIEFLEGDSVAEVFESLIEIGGKNALIVGMGNVGGKGLSLVRHFRNRSDSEMRIG